MQTSPGVLVMRASREVSDDAFGRSLGPIYAFLFISISSVVRIIHPFHVHPVTLSKHCYSHSFLFVESLLCTKSIYIPLLYISSPHYLKSAHMDYSFDSKQTHKATKRDDPLQQVPAPAFNHINDLLNFCPNAEVLGSWIETVLHRKLAICSYCK